MAGFYEHEMRLPRVVSESFLIEMLYAKFRALYEELETEFPINPDFLLMLEFNEHNRKECIDSFKNYFKQKEKVRYS
jgi:hypothetical protein